MRVPYLRPGMMHPETTDRPPKDVALWWRAITHVARLNDEKHLGLIAAGVAFYAILAVFPGIAATIALWGMIGDPALALEQIEEFRALIPSDVYVLLTAQLTKLATTDGLTLGWASLLSFGFALWSARAGVAALMQGLNAIYDAPNRSGLSQYLRAFLLTLSLIGVVLIAMACIVVVPVVLAFLPLGPWANLGVELLRWGVGIGVLLVGFAVIYRLGPNLEGRRPRLISPGVVFAVICWITASSGFSIYLQNFGRYNEIYGSIGAVIVMLMWLFISAYLVLLGGALNAELARARRAKLAIPEPPATSTLSGS
ncbi:YihY/virulence factor BrkB family protein [uncultured Tateyamaria sp.]|uniref:YihY/virulence factor BrkB family protein n=1 Tax=uncultured Tateyamaria sp. TaxID=455651 RepID=UPI0026035855|nr:YihY/virulence factor BrkB family protein [uncultured Tateyamaria sp.]